MKKDDDRAKMTMRSRKDTNARIDDAIEEARNSTEIDDKMREFAIHSLELRRSVTMAVFDWAESRGNALSKEDAARLLFIEAGRVVIDALNVNAGTPPENVDLVRRFVETTYQQLQDEGFFSYRM
ncbi:MAG: hypothetical protein P8Y36_01580 [Alphaproteobacteria bacterium]